jgi:hypothetical protein
MTDGLLACQALLRFTNGYIAGRTAQRLLAEASLSLKT